MYSSANIQDTQLFVISLKKSLAFVDNQHKKSWT